MAEATTLKNQKTGTEQAHALDKTDIKVSASVLKEIHSVEAAPALEGPKVSRNVIRDLKATVEQCERELKKGDVRIAKQYGLDDGQKLAAMKAVISHAERTGRLPVPIDASLVARMKTSIVRNKLDARRDAMLNPGSSPRHRHAVYPNHHDLLDVRKEMFAMVLNNRQLAGLQKGSKTLQEQNEELGFGRDLGGEVGEALEERLKLLLAEEQALSAAQEDRTEEEVAVDLMGIEVDTSFANELRNQQDFGFLQNNVGLDILLDGVVDIVPYIAERRAQETGRDASEVAAEVYQFQELVQKRKKKGGLVTEEDCETLLLVQYLPILYDAVNFIMQKDLPPDAISKMESLKGELAALIQSASDPSSAIFDLFKQIKDSLQDRELVEWTG